MTVAELIARHRPPVVCNEDDLQAWLAELFARHGIDAEREVYLSAVDRVDFMVGGVAIEIKVDGSRASVLRQLDRYASSDRVDELLLVTTVAKHASAPFDLRGKRVETVWVSRL